MQQWVQDELLNGVALNPSTYAIMATYFVQGALGLAALARTYPSGMAPLEPGCPDVPAALRRVLVQAEYAPELPRVADASDGP